VIGPNHKGVNCDRVKCSSECSQSPAICLQFREVILQQSITPPLVLLEVPFACLIFLI
jgi:hypothetical protein